VKQLFILAHSSARANAIQAIKDAPDGYTVEIKPKNRSLEQNRLLHSIFNDLSQQCEWMGQKFSPEIWKRLCVAAWLRENNEQPFLIPSLDKKGVDIIYEKTSKLSVTQCTKLIEWCFAFGAEQNVKFTDRSLENFIR